MLAFAGVGLFLLTSGRSDERAQDLGAFFFLLATPFANRPVFGLMKAVPGAGGWIALVLYTLPLDAFLAWFFWRFAQGFPNSLSSFWVQKFLVWGRRAALVVGAAGLLWQLGGLGVRLATTGGGAGAAALASDKPSYGYYAPLLLLVTLALALLVLRTRGAVGEEGRRARLFVAALVIGLAPLFLQIVLETVSKPYLAFMDADGRRALFAQWVLFPCLASVLFTTSYAVVVGHLLNVRLIARKAVQYALARYSALAIAAVPVTALAVYLYKHRTKTLIEIFSGPHLVLLASSALVGLAALRYRRILLDSIDRHFFREQYDARQTLTLLVERIRATSGVLDLSNLLCREADLALHPESVSLMAFEPRSGLLTDPRVRGRRLDASAGLASLIASATEPLEVDLEDSRSPLARLPDADRHWLVDSGFRLVAPILARDGSLLGLIGLGEKKSGLPFFREDRQLLRAIASSAAWVLELEQSRSQGSSQKSWQDAGGIRATLPGDGRGGDRAGQGVPHCGRLYRLVHRLLQLLQPAAGAVARALRPARQVPLREADRHRRHGRRLPRHRPVPRPAGGRQDPAAGVAGGRHAAAAGGAHGGGGLPPPSGARLRHGDLAGHAHAGHGAARRGNPHPALREGAARSGGDRGPGARHGRGPGAAPRLGHPAPRHQAEQHRLHPRRHPQADGFRHRPRDVRPAPGHRGVARGQRGRGFGPPAAHLGLAPKPHVDLRLEAARGHPLLPLARGAERPAGRHLLRSLEPRHRALRVPARTEDLQRRRPAPADDPHPPWPGARVLPGAAGARFPARRLLPLGPPRTITRRPASARDFRERLAAVRLRLGGL